MVLEPRHTAPNSPVSLRLTDQADGLGGALGACGGLTELNLSSNALADPMALPSSLAALQALDLSRNQLEAPTVSCASTHSRDSTPVGARVLQ